FRFVQVVQPVVDLAYPKRRYRHLVVGPPIHRDARVVEGGADGNQIAPRARQHGEGGEPRFWVEGEQTSDLLRDKPALLRGVFHGYALHLALGNRVQRFPATAGGLSAAVRIDAQRVGDLHAVGVFRDETIRG